MGVIQVLGLISAFATRLRRSARDSMASHWVFFACLGVVAMSTVLMVGAKSGTWLTSGTTFSLMVLTAVWDFGGEKQRSRW
jgi:glycerol uptake facilitator-like aquaporin